MLFSKTLTEIFRDFVTDGVPASGANKPVKADLRAYGSVVEANLVRLRSTGDITRYADATSGNDSNDGLTPGTAWRTLQHAYDQIVSLTDFNGKTVTVRCFGNFTAGLIASVQSVGQGFAGQFIFDGRADGGHPTKASITSTNSNCVTIGGDGIGADVSLYFIGWRLSTVTGGDACHAQGGAALFAFGEITFANIVGKGVFCDHGAFGIQIGGSLEVDGNCDILFCTSVGGNLALHGATVSHLRAVNIGTYVQASGHGQVFVNGMTFVNPERVTGRKFEVLTLGSIAIDPGIDVDYLPGTNQGTVGPLGAYGAKLAGTPSVDSISSSVTLKAEQTDVVVDCSGGNRTITLDQVSNFNTVLHRIKKHPASANTLTIMPNAATGSFIDFASSYVFPNTTGFLEIKSISTGWLIQSKW